LQIGKIMHGADRVVSPDDSLEQARVAMSAIQLKSMPVADQGSLWAVLTLKKIEAGGDPVKRVREIVTPNETFAYVHIDESLSLALERMGSGGVDILPVVSRANLRQMLGVVTLPDVLCAYGIDGKKL
jgi:CBS domain-containing protein